MRKVLIDDIIRSFAVDYRTKVIAKCPNVKQELKVLAEKVVLHNSWNDDEAITDYIDLLIQDYPDILTLEPKDWNINKYQEILRREPAMLTTKVIYGYKANGDSLQGQFYKRIMKCLHYVDARVILGNIHQDMGLKTCVYCNASTAHATDREVMYQMDHFLPQCEYPFLGTCFYNLQPVCGICNGHKGTQLCDFRLFVNIEQHEEVNPFRFLPQIINLTGAENLDCVDIQLVGKHNKTTKKSEEHNKMFCIHDIYEGYKKEVKEIYNKNYQTTPTAIDAFAACYHIQPNKKSVLEFLLNASFEEDKVHEKPLNKLKQDTVKQLEEAHLL